jgi:hypothetical protein
MDGDSRPGRWGGRAMTIVAILVVLLLVFLAFRFVKGMIKFGLIAVVVLVAFLIARSSGAF